MKTLEYVPGTIKEETIHSLRHIDILKEAGATKSVVGKCAFCLFDLSDFEPFHKAFQDFFGDPMLACTTIQASLLRDIKVEIDAIALENEI